MSDAEPDASDLVMPFTVCQSQGGPFDDTAFVAGYRCGMVDAKLAHDDYHEPVMAREAELSQLDLIAMRNEFLMTAQPVDDEWFSVTFTPLIRRSIDLAPGTLLRYKDEQRVVELERRKRPDDGLTNGRYLPGWWLVHGGGLADSVIDDPQSGWSVVS